MKRHLLLIIFFIFFSSIVFSQEIRYAISFENAVHHEANISITYSGLPTNPLQLRMSRSSPGRYALHEFAKNVYNVRVVDGKGNSLRFERPNPHQWDVPSHDGTITVHYTLFADRADGTYSAIDETHAHLNMPATFMYAVGLEQVPIEIDFNVREDLNWRIATQLPHKAGNTFTAPHLDYFFDSPTELSDFDLREWVVQSSGNEYKIRLVMHHEGDSVDVGQYAQMVERVVEEQIAIFGELPAFDYGEYTFLACYLPHVEGDGMEHRNSTILTSRQPLKTGAKSNIGTVSHEFFHTWNVERLRPASLEPFDFAKENMSSELWFAEGFTSYYTNLILCRTGILSRQDYIRSLSGYINYLANSPGRKYFSPTGMSLQAPFRDGAVFLDPVNAHNTFISYYLYGAVIGMALDLSIRKHYPGKNLDTYMKLLWQKFGKPETPYTIDGLTATLELHIGDSLFARDFFDKYIHNSDLPDLASLLSEAGISLYKKNPGQVSLSSRAFTFDGGVAVVAAGFEEGSSLYNAGIGKDDIVLAFDGARVNNEHDLILLFQQAKPGDSAEISYIQRGREKKSLLIFQEDKELQCSFFEDLDLKTTKKMVRFRNSWLNSQIKIQPKN